MRKNIINSIDDNGLGSIGTINTPPTSSDREIVIWNGTDANTLQGGGVRITTGAVIKSPTGVTFSPADFNPGDPYTAWVNDEGELYLGDNPVGNSGDVVGPISSRTRGIAIFPDSSGKSLITTTLIINGSNVIEYPNLTDTTFLSLGSLPFLRTKNASVWIGGTTVQPVNTGGGNLGVGRDALANLTSGADNTAVGFNNSNKVTTGAKNTALGAACLESLTTGIENVAIGRFSLLFLTTGSSNTAVGYGSGSTYTSVESGNIVIGNGGIAGDSNTTRIGTSQTRAFMSGVRGVTVANNQIVTIGADGQLGSQAVPASENISQNWTTAFSVTATNLTLILSKSGRNVTCYIPTFTASLPTPAANCIIQSIPAAYQSGVAARTNLRVTTGGSEVDCMIYVNATQIMFKKQDGSNFASGAISIDNGICLSWLTV